MAQNAVAIRLQFETLRTLAFGAISGTYAAVGTALSNPSRKLIVQNLTDVTITFSNDGTNDKFVLGAGGQIILDCRLGLEGDYFPQGMIIYAKGAPGSGSVYVSTIYGAV